MMTASRRVVLREDVKQDAIDDLMFEQGWQLTNVVAASLGIPGQLIFTSAEGTSVLYFVEDSRLGWLYFTVHGEKIDAVLEDISQQLPHYDTDALGQLLSEETTDPNVLSRRLGLYALVFTDPDEMVISRFREALTHKRDEVRLAALTAISYAPWPALRAALHAVRDGDDNPGLRMSAGKVLEGLYQ